MSGTESPSEPSIESVASAALVIALRALARQQWDDASYDAQTVACGSLAAAMMAAYTPEAIVAEVNKARA